ncbi:DsbA family protein [Hydrocarboniclastica marina]|uniref:DsbA family protein n=1 Tax=Hydrocarboniclastica marina TaxID=2259620 RepID=A0A4P7XLQ5_9ALTE|nr:DsbA family protein [Hydrocarboniclastica marina]QCF28048.1 DsbA family protein [Hydrocarboniclastica marina]
MSQANTTTKTKTLIFGGLVLAIVLSALALFQQNATGKKIDRLAEIAEQQSKMLNSNTSQADIEQMMAAQIAAFEREKQLRQYKSVSPAYSNAQERLESEDLIYGNPDAEFSVIEFSDFDCPYCKSYHETPKKVVDQAGGDVNWVWKHFPVHPSARSLHEATSCIAKVAGNKEFWTASQLVFDNGGSNGIKPGELADLMPIDRKAFDACMASGEMKSKVEEDYKFGQQAGVSGTPASSVIHHKTGEVYTLSGAVPEGQLQAAITQLRKKAAAAESVEGDNIEEVALTQ